MWELGWTFPGYSMFWLWIDQPTLGSIFILLYFRLYLAGIFNDDFLWQRFRKARYLQFPELTEYYFRLKCQKEEVQLSWTSSVFKVIEWCPIAGYTLSTLVWSMPYSIEMLVWKIFWQICTPPLYVKYTVEFCYPWSISVFLSLINSMG